MEKYLWRERHGSIPARLVTRRAIARGVCLLAFFTLMYHLFTSVALRSSISSVGDKMLSPATSDCGGHCAPPPPQQQQQQQQQPEQQQPEQQQPEQQQPEQQQPEQQQPERQQLEQQPQPPQHPALTQTPTPPPPPAPKFDGTDSKVTIGKEKATLLMLVRNRELNKALGSMRMVEDRFNRNFKYPWTFMNDRPFTDEFIKYTSGLASGPVEYVQIPKEHWSVPPTLNRSRIDQGMKSLRSKGVIYGGSLSYRHMCRFNSGFFFRQQALAKYDWYWRVEPDIELWCDITYDPFAFMRRNGKVYGWVLSMYEFLATIPTLFESTKEFVELHPQHLAPDNSLAWIVDDANTTRALTDGKISGNYNLCHFWSNFEIASLEFFRGPAYSQYFRWLDSTGGFFYERWGDAPVHSLALSLFVPRTKIHHFSDFGYNHSPASRCPQDDASHLSGRCVCDRKHHNFDTDQYSCGPRWFKLNGAGVGVKYPPEPKE